MTQANQNLTVTNEILKIKSLEESQSELLGRIKELFSLVNLVVNLTPKDVPEQHVTIVDHVYPTHT